MISFIVPAHNEESGIAQTLQAIHNSARATGQPYEVIVVDDASTDATAQIASQHNATVLPVNHRQISATRNSGGRAARGHRLFFVDADTIINPLAVAAALRAMDKGAAGGGASTKFEDTVPLYARLLFFMLFIGGKIAEITGGAFMFCTRKAFDAVGGFDERLYAAEEIAMASALKREGPFVVLWKRVITSGRRFRALSGLQMIVTAIRLAFLPSQTLTRRSSVKKVWYNSDRTSDEKISNALTTRVSNAIALFIMLVLLTAPIWFFVPWPQTLFASPLGAVRILIGIILSHAGLLLWPFAILLFRTLLRQTRWVERMKMSALLAFCVWRALDSTQAALRVWMWLFHHL